jgi:putative drug exporter of the RND superfamily
VLTLARMSVRRPKSALAGWLLVAVVLTLIGFGVNNALSPSVTVVPGTQSSRAQQLANAQFGPTQLMPILLEGSKAQLNAQGPKLVVALAKRPNTRVLSAWDAGTASAGLRPDATHAMIVVSVDRSEKNVVQYDLPQIQKLVSQRTSGGVKAFITGQASLDRADRTASTNNLRRTELIAVGIVFLLLLIGLRAPVAAVIVTAVGAISMLAGFGEVALLGKVLQLDAVGVALGTMTGLALGVGFSLLILDRFHREELPEGAHPRDAVTAATRELETTGRAVLVAGTAIIVAVGLVAVVGPTQLLVSVGAGMLTCAMFATGGAVVVMPAALVLLGRRIDWLSFPAPALLARAWSRLVDGGNWVTRRAVYTGFAATVILAAIAVPALALKTGPQDISQLPANSQARIAFTEISRVMGPGWATPYNMVVVANNRPITTPVLLAQLNALQVQIAKNNAVDTVTGPGQINATSTQLKSFGPGIKNSVKISDQSKKDLLTLIRALGQAGAGSSQLQSGLASASSGAGQLATGGGSAQSGAGQLHAGLASAMAGSTTLRNGLNTALSAAIQLRNGAGTALSGASQLAAGLGKGAPQVAAGLPAVGTLVNESNAAVSSIKSAQGQQQQAQGSVGQAISALQGMGAAGKADPNYTAALNALQSASGSISGITGPLSSAAASASGAAGLSAGVKAQVETLAPQLTAAASGAAALASGLSQLQSGNAQLASGISQLAGGGGQLTSGLGQLTNGAGQLQAGLSLLSGGAGTLANGLAGGVAPAGQLTTGLGQMQAAVVKSRGQIPSTTQLKQLEAQAPGIFSSGYFVLAAVEGSTPANRNAATFMLNVLRGGTAAQIVVIPKYKMSDPRSVALGASLTSMGTTFAKKNNVQIAIGGPAGSLGDLTSVTKSRIWLDVAVLAAAIMLVLALAMRAVLLPLVATVFSLLTTAATFGILTLLFSGNNPPLGGPGHLDPASIIGIFTIAFSMTVAFSTLVLMRAREAFVANGKTKEAVMTALRETAAATTGAGIVMVAALIPFITTDFLQVRAFGIGVAIAILLDVLIVRPLLIPAAAAVLGKVGWWPTRAPVQTPPATPSPHRARWPHRARRPHRAGAAH